MFRQLTYADFTISDLQETHVAYNMVAICFGDEQGVSWIREDNSATDYEAAEYEAYERRCKEWD